MGIPVLVLVGATATGKSALGLDVCRTFRARGIAAEVVNADSMLVYRGMDIGTAKPSARERAEVPHHLVDVLDVTEDASVATFQGWARAAIAECRGRGCLPVVVGGSALYLRAILDHFTFPPTDPACRHRWEQRLAAEGSVALHQELARRAPETAAGILPTNGRRVARALEALELTGEFRSTLPAWEYAVNDVIQVGLRVDRPTMDARIEHRVFQMWDSGFVAEVQRLVQRGLRRGRTASRALGYQQILAALGGECTLDAAREATVLGTRRFARKQLGWFARDPRIDWLQAGAEENVPAVVAKVEKMWPSGGPGAMVGRNDEPRS